MKFRRSVVFGVLVCAVLLTGIVLCGLIWRHPELLGIQTESARQTTWLSVTAVATIVVSTFLGGFYWLGHQLGQSAYSASVADDVPDASTAMGSEPANAQTNQTVDSVKASLRQTHGPFWRHKTRILLIIGEPTHIEAIAPGLAEKQWLETQNTVLLWGGSSQVSLSDAFQQWRGLGRWRALDGVVWALDQKQSANATFMTQGVRHIQALARELHWQLPLHMWQVCDSTWPQPKRPTQPVGCLLPTSFTPAQLEDCLASLQQPLREQGIAQMQSALGHDFLYRLSRDLEVEGIARWRQALEPLLGTFARGVPLRGLWFSLPLPTDNSTDQHHWPVEPSWSGVLNDKAPKGQRLGWNTTRIGYVMVLCLALLWGGGLLLSFVTNRTQIEQLHASLTTLQQSQTGDAQLLALNEWVRELSRLDYRAQHGAPWYQRFGLNQNAALLSALWPQYIAANHRLMRDPAAADLERQLEALVKLPSNSPERFTRAPLAYEQLKTYLMMARPEKANAQYLAKSLSSAEPERDGLSLGVWQGVSPALWKFYSEQLPAHPQWRIEPDAKLVAQVRLILLAQLSRRNAEASQYKKILDAAAEQYPPLDLSQMVGETEAFALFSNSANVPGEFTRQAWEGQVRQAIDDIARRRHEVIDWVLSDNPADIAADMTSEQLKQRLTERYFQDYSSAWLSFLNKTRWHKADNLTDVIDQLTLMSDARQSPLIELFKTLAYQGKAGINPVLDNSLIQSAKQLIGQHKVPAINEPELPADSPLDGTFGPLLALTNKDESQNTDDNPSLQTFLTRVTRVRLKLQQITLAPDPQDMTQALAQTVFQGKSIDLTDTQSYGSLVAASLGNEWAGIGRTLFVQPLEQAWHHVLQPSAAGLNNQWQRAIVSDWNAAFTGRYPFAVTGSDASLPMLGQMIRADSGRIEQFLKRELGGVLRKDGSRWVADTRNGQGLRIDPRFLTAINQLSQLADVLYTDGGMGLSFELRGKAVRDVVQTSFILNGERHHYFNQKESWQRFGWPGTSDHPGASLTWTSVSAGERLFGDYQGTWGLIRLLENAQITALDDGDSRYRIVLTAPDGLGLTWHLRTQLGAGPMALLALRDFKLPQRIFLGQRGTAKAIAQNEAYE
jgi:type VI secretion system protein ImpL